MDDVLQWGKHIFTVKKKEERKNIDAFKADQHIYYCNSCDRCWEKTKQQSRNYIEMYEDFVTYGKERKICKYCTPDKSV